MAKKYLDVNVYDAAMTRIAYLFSEFDNVLVAFSGGKDSGVCLNLCYDYAKSHGMLDKLAMYHLDYEAQYQMTTDYVTECFSGFDGIRKFWLCLPVSANCGCKMDSGTWIPWHPEEQEIWARDMPDSDYLVDINNCPFDIEIGEQDYAIQDRFSEWFETKYGKTATVIGIRADESLNRYSAISSDKVRKYKEKNYINGHNAYPIYDWTVSDIWTYNGKFAKNYNRLYDLYYQAGLSVDQMRVANPFHSCGMDNLKLYKVIEPHTWGKLVSRVNGVNFAGIYGGTTAMGWKSITLPKWHTWKSYFEFLLTTMDEKTRNHYLEKFHTSAHFWKEKGGALDDDIIEQIKETDTDYEVKGAISNQSRKNVVKFNEYPDDMDIRDFKSVPSYKRMCICILKNDYYCKYMGFAQNKQEKERRAKAIEKYKNL